ncbi:hypothetical protein AQ505_19040 [Pedobacter sp. PACM 27299]|uniref:helix-turn-helix domain-containing protein n=1 Tax=Pedobacter sp. PACM 27299 TaxID=1727164 RepID=UPI0007061749|nr:helix-turn-helix transcriptional regulator [Pedobacter sp. PACM 27299]ALL07399.1 hypothetical protein AQ505_19040 [Pedobacter sp. PACM 27299]
MALKAEYLHTNAWIIFILIRFIQDQRNMQFGNALRIQRVIKGYTQDYMAERLHLSQNSYSKLERGLTSLTVSRLYQIAEILEISIQDILPAQQPGNTKKSDSAENI